MSIVKLPVYGGQDTIVDKVIAEKLKGKQLFSSKSNRYVRIKGRKLITLHRFVSNAPQGKEVDHLNGNVFDNRICNLRICNRSENCSNRKVIKNRSSGYRNVYKNTIQDSYRLSFVKYDKTHHVCVFRSRHVAGIFADQVLVRIVGTFVQRNFPEKINSSSLIDFLNSTSGRIFKVVFSRRSDGRQREMVCRTGVKAHQTGGTILFNPISRNLFSVYDVRKKAYRFIPLENVICIRFAKTNYRVVA